MDPHSTRAQFNSRKPKSGPSTSKSRYMESQTAKTKLDSFTKGSAKKATSRRDSSSSILTPRPMVTNSRIKQNEKYRSDMHLVYVNNALEQKSLGNSGPFDELVQQFNAKPRVEEAEHYPLQLKLWIQSLSHVVSRLERTHAELVEAIIELPWTTMDTPFVKHYTLFIGMLISARPEYLALVLNKVAQGFTYQSALQALDNSRAESSSRPMTRATVFDRLHLLLQHLLSLIPTMPNALQPILMRHFPHKRQSQTTQICYIRNILHLTDYCPELNERIMAIIIDRAIQIDVEIQVELDDIEKFDHDDDLGAVFELDPFESVIGEGDPQESEDGSEDDVHDDFSDLPSDDEDSEDDVENPTSTDVKHIEDMVSKLDAILKLVFDHFHRINVLSIRTTPNVLAPDTPLSSPRPDSPASSSSAQNGLPRPSTPMSIEQGKLVRRAQFFTLLSIFDRTIIRTFKSRYTQFLIFWYSSLDPEYSDIFQGMLVEKALFDIDQPMVTRAAAASYVASFVSRAQFVDRDSTQRVVAMLCEFLRVNLDIYEAGQFSASSRAQSGVFYAVTQAIFLIFCFRWRDLLEIEEAEDQDEIDTSLPAAAKKWMPQLNILQRVIVSPMNPLRVCSQNVVLQFARIAQATDFVYCYSVLDANRRSEYAPEPENAQTESRTSGHGVLEPVNAELHAFFPFDPYKLPRSSSYIHGVYREWSSVAIDNPDEDDEEDQEADSDEESGPASLDKTGSSQFAIPRRGDKAADELGTSFGGMSISPIRGIVVV